MGGADIAVTAISSLTAIALAYIAKQNRDIRTSARENTTRLGNIEHQTNGQMDSKIRSAVLEVFQQHKTEVTEAVMAESVRHLLDAMLNMPTENDRERSRR